eukprot:15414985-Alexandrium_andersonii.AAC.1
MKAQRYALLHVVQLGPRRVLQVHRVLGLAFPEGLYGRSARANRFQPVLRVMVVDAGEELVGQ